MVAELYTEAANDAETVVVAWLKDLRPNATANTRRMGDPLPFTLVTEVAGKESVEESWNDPVIQVDTLCAKSLGRVAARDEGLKTHKRMLLLARYLEDVDLGSGVMATVDYVKVFTPLHEEPYGDDQIIRKVARYQLGLSYSPLP